MVKPIAAVAHCRFSCKASAAVIRHGIRLLPAEFERHVARLARDPLGARRRRRGRAQVKSAVACAVGIAIECDVRDGVAPGGEPVVSCKVSLHHAKRGIPFACHSGIKCLFSRVPHSAQRRARSGQPRHRARDCIARRTSIAGPRRGPSGRRATESILAQVPKNRVRLRKHTPVLEFEQRHAAIGIFRKKVGLARGPVMKSVILEFEIDVSSRAASRIL